LDDSFDSYLDILCKYIVILRDFIISCSYLMCVINK